MFADPVYEGRRDASGRALVLRDGVLLVPDLPFRFFARRFDWGRPTRCATQLAAVLLSEIEGGASPEHGRALRLARLLTQRLPRDGWMLRAATVRELVRRSRLRWTGRG